METPSNSEKLRTFLSAYNKAEETLKKNLAHRSPYTTILVDRIVDDMERLESFLQYIDEEEARYEPPFGWLP